MKEQIQYKVLLVVKFLKHAFEYNFYASDVCVYMYVFWKEYGL